MKKKYLLIVADHRWNLQRKNVVRLACVLNLG
jgi:hypothetical protein